jgi:hypothetical protein
MTTLSFLILLLCKFLTLVLADGETGSGRIGSGQCPENVEAIMVYSPFRPYWRFSKFAGDIQKCWVATDCLFEAASESRKQQFAATAFIMGLIPLTLRDIAWPERRIFMYQGPCHGFPKFWSQLLGSYLCRPRRATDMRHARKARKVMD